MFILVKEILFFLKNGDVRSDGFESDVKLVLYVYILKVLAFFLFVLLGFVLFDLDFLVGVNSVPSGRYLRDFLNFLILAPVLEEIICRYHNKLKVKNILASIVASCLLFYDKLWFLLVVDLYLILLLYLTVKSVEFDRLFVIYVSAFIFGFSHVVYSGGFHDFQSVIPLFCMFCFRFVGGLMYSYLFFKKGIYLSIILHFLWNLVPFLLSRLSFMI